MAAFLCVSPLLHYCKHCLVADRSCPRSRKDRGWSPRWWDSGGVRGVGGVRVRSEFQTRNPKPACADISNVRCKFEGLPLWIHTTWGV